MGREIFSKDMVADCAAELNIRDLGKAAIADVLGVAVALETKTGIPFIRMDQGIPGLPAAKIGVEAEKKALDEGVANKYPPAAGLPALKNAASRFVKAYLDVDISPRSCIPGTGSASISFAAFAITTQLAPEKDTILFIDPGFPVQKAQLSILGIRHLSFDVKPYRGAALRGRLEEYLSSGRIAALIYSNPNNPAWISFNEDELRIIGGLAEKYGVIVLEDLAYFCMDSREDFGKPFSAPYPPTVARYTDNYILMLSASKMFSYAGQRLGMACISDTLASRRFPALASRYSDSGIFAQTYAGSILYTISAGTAFSTQYAVAAMMDAACDGKYDFVSDNREYARRAERMKAAFVKNGFHIVYDEDCGRPIGDGFFFSVGYGKMTGAALMEELLYYGISSISLSTTGSDYEGVRACVSKMTPGMFPLLEERLGAFNADHNTENA